MLRAEASLYFKANGLSWCGKRIRVRVRGREGFRAGDIKAEDLA